MKRLLFGLLVGVLVADCGGPALTPTPSTSTVGQSGGTAVLAISNGTTLPVTLFLNGRALGTATPGVGMPPIDFATLPPLPWTVEARSPSGRVLTSMTVLTGNVWATTDPAGNVETNGAMGRVDLSCGRLTIWAGYNAPSGPVPPSPAGTAGDCAP